MRSLVVVVACGCGRLGFEPLEPNTPVGGACAIDAECTAHAACDLQACVCAAGFTADATGACAWTGGIVANPALSDPTAWTTTGGATIDPMLMDAGMLDPGAARIATTALCNLARVTQMVTMPRESLAGPLAIDIQYRYTDMMMIDFGAPAVGLGGVWRDDFPGSQLGWRAARACVASGQYAPESTAGAGAPVALTVMPASAGIDCMFGSELAVDHVDIVPADPGECAPSGEAANGDAESTGGWTFAAGASSVAAIVDGVGDNGSRGVRLYLGKRCDDPYAADEVSVATADVLAHPAFELYDRTAMGIVADVSLGGRHLSLAPGTGVGRVTHVCVPASMRGGSYTFAASLDGGSGTCGDALGYESIVDELRLVDDPRCAGDALVDPGFEAQLPLLGAYSFAGKGTAQIVTGTAHAGAAALRLDASVTCYGGTWNADVVALPSVSAAGPALSFFYRADPANKTKFEVIASAMVFTGTADDTWRQGLVCLDPKLAGRPQTVSFTREFVGGTCEVAMPTEAAFVDDVSLTTDPSCPP